MSRIDPSRQDSMYKAMFRFYYIQKCPKLEICMKVDPKSLNSIGWAGDRSAGFQLKFIVFNWILINSGQKLLLYGPRIGIIYSYPGNIEN